MTEDKTVIDLKLIEIKDNIILILSPDHYNYKVKNIQILTLSRTINDFKFKLNAELMALPQISYLDKQLTVLINGLDEKFSETDFRNISPKYISAIKTGWNEIRLELNKFHSTLIKILQEHELQNDEQLADIDLTRDQVALLITYLRECKLISLYVPDKTVADYFGIMTGYSGSKLRQKISGISKYEHNLITDLEKNYSNLSDKLKSIISLIEEDKRKAILKKAK